MSDVVQDVKNALVLPDNVGIDIRRTQVREALTKVLEIENLTHSTSAELLWEIMESEYFKDWEFDNFNAFVDQELPISPRKARYLAKSWEVFVIDCAMSPEEFRNYSWVYLKAIQPVVTAENLRKILKTTEHKTIREIEEWVKIQKADKTGEDVFLSMNFKLTKDQTENVSHALEAAKRMTGSDKTGNCLDLIATDFLSGLLGEGMADDLLGSLEKVLKAIERAYNVTIEKVVKHDESDGSEEAEESEEEEASETETD